MASKTESESAYSDVSKAQEQAEKDAQKPTEYDADGNVKDTSSGAAAEVYDEMARRSAGAANGGGPWPPDLLRERYIGSTPIRRGLPEYTSHEKPNKKDE